MASPTRPIFRQLLCWLLLVPHTTAYSDETGATAAAIDAASRAVLDQCRRASFRSSTYWTSQPGALRAFDRSSGALQSLYKLYSSPTQRVVQM